MSIVMGKKGMSALEQILIGSVTERVIGYSNADVLVVIVGSHGRTGLRRLLMGSTCQRVIGLSKVPVLVVK